MIENERKKKLLETMKDFNKEEKDEILCFGNEVEDQEVIPTGIKVFDKWLGGGIKRGTHTILWGPFSSGKTSLGLQSIGNAQKLGYICAYINLEKPVDNERFIAMGVNLNQLIRSDCTKNAEQALKVIQKLCKAKVVDLIIVDSIQSLSPKAENENKGKERELYEKTMGELARTMSEFCRRVNADIYRAKAGIIWIGQIRINIGSFFSGATLTGGEALKFYAYQMAFMRRGQSANAPVEKFKEYLVDPEGKIRYQTKKESIGFESVLKMDKTNSCKSVKEKTEQAFLFVFNKGFVDEVIEQEDVPIKIHPDATDEEKEKINKHLVDKGLVGSPEEKIAKIVQPADLPKDPGSVVEKLVKTLPKKRGRGRPKKVKA